jgi:hypothetical protein
VGITYTQFTIGYFSISGWVIVMGFFIPKTIYLNVPYKKRAMDNLNECKKLELQKLYDSVKLLSTKIDVLKLKQISLLNKFKKIYNELTKMKIVK